MCVQINQAMALGVPVVATPVAVEGMGLADGQECMIANSALAFAQKLVQVGAC